MKVIKRFFKAFTTQKATTQEQDARYQAYVQRIKSSLKGDN